MRGRRGRTASRVSMAVVVVLWAAGAWLIVNPVQSIGAPLESQSCVPNQPPPLGCPTPSASTSSATPSPSRSTASPTATSTSTSTTSPTSTSTSSPTQTSSPSTSPSDPPPVVTTYPTGVTIRYSDRSDEFRGAVESSARRCTQNRAVTVFRQRPGRDRAVGFDRTNSRGRYRVGYRGRNGRFYAVAAKKEFNDAEGNRVICSRGRSRSIRP